MSKLGVNISSLVISTVLRASSRSWISLKSICIARNISSILSRNSQASRKF